MRRVLSYLLPCILLLAACSDPIRIDAGPGTEVCLAVDGMLTDQGCHQVVRLSLTTDFFSPASEIPWVSGAKVSVSCGQQVYAFREDPDEPGTYRSVDAFKGETGKTYRLDIDATVGGKAAHYSAEDTVPAPGLELDAIDYLYSTHIDHMWTLALWGRDFENQQNRYMLQLGINGHFKPLDETMEFPDHHFDGKAFSGVTAITMNHTEQTWETYGDCFKPLERGDVITLNIFTLSEGYGEFLMTYHHLLSGTVPITSEQPSNLQTNIRGEAPAVGYFGACAVTARSCVVDDPFRTEYRIPR